MTLQLLQCLHTFNIAELLISIVAPNNEANADTETQEVTAEIKKQNAESSLKPYAFFYGFHSLNSYVLFILNDNFSFLLFS